MTFTAKIKVTKVKVGLFSQNQSNSSKSWLFQLTSKLQKLEFAVSDYIKVMKGRDYHSHIFQQINHNSASAPSSLLMSPSASTFTTGVLTLARRSCKVSSSGSLPPKSLASMMRSRFQHFNASSSFLSFQAPAYQIYIKSIHFYVSNLKMDLLL